MSLKKGSKQATRVTRMTKMVRQIRRNGFALSRPTPGTCGTYALSAHLQLHSARGDFRGLKHPGKGARCRLGSSDEGRELTWTANRS